MAKNKKTEVQVPDLTHPAAGKAKAEIDKHVNRAKHAKNIADKAKQRSQDEAAKAAKAVNGILDLAGSKVAAAKAAGKNWPTVVNDLTAEGRRKEQADKARALSRRLKDSGGKMLGIARVNPLKLKTVEDAKRTKRIMSAHELELHTAKTEREKAENKAAGALKVAAVAHARQKISAANLDNRQEALRRAVTNNRELADVHKKLKDEHEALKGEHERLKGEHERLTNQSLVQTVLGKLKRSKVEESELVESIERCHVHDINYDSDESNCPECEQEEYDKNPPEERPLKDWPIKGEQLPKITNEEITEVAHLIIQRRYEKI